MNEIIEIISKLGFPIGAFIMAAWLIRYLFDKFLQLFEKMREDDRAQTNALMNLTSAVNNNTEVLRDLVTEVKANDKSGGIK